jgi:imidazolonepropionase-like amidohydrolase
MNGIRAARLFDGESATLVNDPVVLMDDGRIAGIQSGAPAPEAAKLVDLGDVTLLPGLIDAHVHLAFDAGPDPVGRLADSDDDEVLEGMHTAARTTLAAGVTTVRDLGDRDYLALKLRDELAGEPAGGPEVLAAGPPITTSRGHCWFLGGEADGVDGVRAAVREHVERGVDVIKMMASGGELTDGSHSHVPQYGLAELSAAAEEAHRAGLPITAHAHAGQAIADVVAAGFDSIEHCSFMTEDGVEPRPEVIAALARAGVAVSATLGFLPGFTPPPGIAARIPALMAVLRQLDEAGVTMVCGTDAGIGPPKPHGILPQGVAMLTDVLGWTAVDALRSATSVAARICHVCDRKGRLAAGYDADMVAVAGNPLDDISALLDVQAVVRAGHLVTT